MEDLAKAGALPETVTNMHHEVKRDAWSSNTKSTYGSAYKGYLKVCQVLCMDPLCRLPGGGIEDNWQMENRIAAFIVVCCGLRELNPESVSKVYLPAIAGTFDMIRAECAIRFRQASNSKEIKLVTAGFERRYNSKHPAVNRIRMPYDMDMAIKSRRVMQDQGIFAGQDSQVLRDRVFVCSIVGITFLLRKSEHMRNPNEKAAATPLFRRHITFFALDKQPIPYDQVGFELAEKVVVNVTFAKNDQSGYGRRTRHARQFSSPATCVVTILEEYIRVTRDKYQCVITDELYYLPTYGSLKVEVLHSVMQATARACGIRSMGKKVTSHSLRYGGATMLAAAGLPQYIIAIYGGWSPDSKSLRRYTKPSDEMVERVSEHIATMGQKESSVFFAQEAFVISEGEAADREAAAAVEGARQGKGKSTSQFAKW